MRFGDVIQARVNSSPIRQIKFLAKFSHYTVWLSQFD